MEGPATISRNTAPTSLVERMIGAAKLDAPTYEAVEHDESATSQALIVVVLAAVAGGIGAIANNGIGGLIGGILTAVLGWLIFSAMAYFVGTRLVPDSDTSATIGQLLRTLGFAQAPGVLAILGFIPVLGVIIALVASIWTLVAEVVAIRQALEMSTGRAIGVALLSFVILVLILGVLAAVLGISLAAFG